MDRNAIRVAGASHVGRSHLRDGVECQDHAAGRLYRDTACIALADGAGSRPYSALGAQTVVRETLRICITRFDVLFERAVHAPTLLREDMVGRLQKALARTARAKGCDTGALASTLIFVAQRGKRFVAGHIGDGLIVRMESSGKLAVLSQPDNGEFLNETFFVTDPAAVARLRLYHGDDAEAGGGFLCMSDGPAESLYRRSTQQVSTACEKLLRWNSLCTRQKMSTVLASNLADVMARNTNDDCSIALMSSRIVR